MNKVCIITGASGDLGSYIAETFARNNYNLVLIFNKNKEQAIRLKNHLLDKYNIKVMTEKVDITNENEICHLKDKILKEFDRVDSLVNNAAVEISCDLKDKNYNTFKEVLDVNVIGTFLMCKHFGDIMVNQKNGKIVNISSNNGIDKYDPSTLEYDLSKSAIINMTKNLAKAYSPFVNVNSVAPGWIKTDKIVKLDSNLDNKFITSESEKILLKRFANPDEIAEVVYFLCSDKSNYINAEVIKVDGGNNE